MEPRDIDALMATHREPAIMVHRPYPPPLVPCGGSHYGGRPALPAGVPWPRTSAGVPLHFLARIDCAALPDTGGVLPVDGVLFFFARVDSDLMWQEGSPRDACRVLYVAKAGAVEADPPEGLLPILGGRSEQQRWFRFPSEPPVALYPRWPISFYAISSWPDQSAIPGWWDRDMKGYQEAVVRARAAETVRLPDLPLAVESTERWDLGANASAPVPTADGRVEKPFPQAWVMVDRICRALIQLIRREKIGFFDHTSRTKLYPEMRSFVVRGALQWVRRAALEGHDHAPAPEAAARFAQWLSMVAGIGHLKDATQIAINVGMLGVTQAAGASPALAALIPPAYYAMVAGRHSSARVRWQVNADKSKTWRIATSFHQMLGNAPSSQEARSVKRDEILLLHLMSDYGVNFMFGDCGEAEFWIHKDDLKRRNFDNVFATVRGG